jgi:hypothetical protein
LLTLVCEVLNSRLCKHVFSDILKFQAAFALVMRQFYPECPIFLKTRDIFMLHTTDGRCQIMNVVLSKLRILSHGEGRQMESISIIQEARQYTLSSCQKGDACHIATILC